MQIFVEEKNIQMEIKTQSKLNQWNLQLLFVCVGTFSIMSVGAREPQAGANRARVPHPDTPNTSGLTSRTMLTALFAQ